MSDEINPMCIGCFLNSHLALESQPIQDAIDAVLFHFCGLTSEETHYIDQPLKEML